MRSSDRQKFGLVLVPAEILTWTGIPVSVPAEISVQMLTEMNRN